MPDNDCPINRVNCVSLARVEALERALSHEKELRSRTHEKIFDRLGELERGMAMVTTQYTNIAERLASIASDLNDLKEKPGKRWDTIITALITGVVSFVLGLVLKGGM